MFSMSFDGFIVFICFDFVRVGDHKRSPQVQKYENVFLLHDLLL